MRIYRLALGIAIGSMLIVATGWADDSPRKKKIHSSFACSFSPSTFDPNNDGRPAGLDLCNGKGNLGPFTIQLLNDLLPPLAAPVTCPPGTVEFPYASNSTVTTYENTLDQLVSGASTGTLCFSPNGSTFTFDVTEDILGGTGKLTGATGSIQSKGSGAFVRCDRANRCVGNYAGTSTGTLILP